MQLTSEWTRAEFATPGHTVMPNGSGPTATYSTQHLNAQLPRPSTGISRHTRQVYAQSTRAPDARVSSTEVQIRAGRCQNSR